MIETTRGVVHAVGVCLPFGVLVGVLLAPARLSGVDFRQWFRDPGQPAAYSDDSWIGLLNQGIAIAFLSAVGGVLLLGAWLAWPSLSLRSCCRLPDVWDVVGYLLPYVLGLIAGIALAQFAAEMAWRFGLAAVPDALPSARRLSRAAPIHPPQPRARTGRRLIVCCDGTWNWPDRQRETNVVRLVRAIAAQAPATKDSGGCPIPQISHYHVGVGTGNVLDRIIGGGTGVGLSTSVKACYGFLVDNYAPGDEILLFGFSRGAYVARSVAGMVGRVGILQRSEMEHFLDAWDWYTDDPAERDPGDLDAIAPNRVRGRDVDIECIGVWDTVGALGIPGTRFCASSFKFHETELGPGVRHAFHAMAMDERRGNFQAAVWTPNPAPRSGQVLEQVWFPGVHSNIGGGYEQHGLSDTTMLWMLSRILAHDLLALDMEYIASALDRSERYPIGVLADSRKGSWTVVGSPVPRPVGITSDTELVHESALERAADTSPSLAHDIYTTDKRKRWLSTMGGRIVTRCPLEIQYAVNDAVITDAAKPYKRKRPLGICDRLLRKYNGPV